MKFEFTFKARGYELDSYGHVNHAVYLNYFEQARWELFQQLGLVDFFRENGLLLVVVEVKVRYHREINLFNEMVIATEIAREAPYLVFRQQMHFRDSNVKACSAVVKTLFIDNGRLVRDVPENVLEMISSEGHE